MAAERIGFFRLRLGARSVRARTTVGAVLVVGVALVGSALALITLMQQTLEQHAGAAAQTRAQEVAAFLEDGMLPSSLRLANEEDAFVQVITDAGEVLASTPSVEGQPPVARLGAGQSRIVYDLPEEDRDPFLVIAERAHTPAGGLVVLVGRNLNSVEESASVVTNILLVAVPVLLIVVGATTWAVVGRALAPVEAMRQEVAEVSAAELHRRVPTPSGDDEIARLARTMNAMLSRLDEAHARQQRLVSDASHELRSPIAAIRQHAEVAQSHPEETTVGDLADDVLGEDLRLERLAEDILLLARADEHTLGLTARPLDLDDLVLAEARRLGQVTGFRIDTSGVSAARARGDRQQLQSVVRNLADNAARHASSVIRLAVREDNGDVVLEVDDDGPGVPPELRSVVFERFTRLDPARDRQHGGAGLGLAIVAEIVAAHGGSASVSDAPLGGARFEVILPQGRWARG